MSKDYDEVERLWRAIKRDYFAQVMVFAGFDQRPREEQEKGWQRLLRNWDALCDLDMNVAASLAHGFEQVSMVFDRPGDPAGPGQHRLRQLSEIVGVVTKGREANPDAEVDTVGELYALGEEAIEREVDDDFGKR